MNCWQNSSGRNRFGNASLAGVGGSAAVLLSADGSAAGGAELVVLRDALFAPCGCKAKGAASGGCGCRPR